MPRTAILLLAFGGPESLDEIGPFMAKLMGRTPAPQIVERVAERYRTIGGGSPLPRIVREQSAALERALADEGAPTVRPAFKYTKPSITETVHGLAADGFDRVIGISLSAHFSRVSTGAYFGELREAGREAGVEVITVDGYHAHPIFLDAIAEKARLALAMLDKQDGDHPLLVFTAHSLPIEYVEQGDPYVEQIQETIDGVIQRLSGYEWRLAYQSRGLGQGRWLEPDIEPALEELAAERRRSIVLIPISFACDHVETLYDVDVVIAGKAKALGLRFVRTEALNTSSLFIEALAAAVRPHLTRTG